LWVVRVLSDGKWTTTIHPGHEKSLVQYGDAKPESVAVSAVTRLGKEGEIVTAEVK
jgi:hypothetical protein